MKIRNVQKLLPLLASLTVFLASQASAADYNLGALTIQDPWARASAGRMKAGAAFLTISNEGETDRLLQAKADVADAVELHTHIRDGEIMRMRQVEAIDVTGGTVTNLQPGGLHIMFIGLKAPLKEGETFPLTLEFEKAGSVKVDVEVKNISAMGNQPADHMHGQHGMKHNQ